MQDNPFSAILNTVRQDSDARRATGWLTGTVLSTAPLCIRADGIELTSEDLLVNFQLAAHPEPVTLTELVGDIAGTPAVTVSGGTLRASGMLGGILEAGDTVVLLRDADGQQFIVLCKVVQVQ